MNRHEEYICKAKLDLKSGFVSGTDTSLVFQADWSVYENSIEFYILPQDKESY